MKHFINTPDRYKRNFSLIPTYLRDAPMYLHLQTGRPIEECYAYVKKETGPGGKMAMVMPEARVLVRGKNGDRKEETVLYQDYLDTIENNGEILSPSMTAYLPITVKESILGEYVNANMQRRGLAKKEKFSAKMAKNFIMEAFYEGLQTSLKIKNNSLSGAHCSPLTSGCRTATSYANATNEKFLAGNRHYWAPDVVTSNVVSIINLTNLTRFESMLSHYGIRAPTVEETMECITYSSNLYWRNPEELATIQNLVNNLSDVQRSAFVYTGDLYHLAKCNPDVVRDFLTAMSTLTVVASETPDDDMKAVDGNAQAFLSLLFGAQIKGVKFDDIAKKCPQTWGFMGTKARELISVLDHYEELIKVLWVSDNMIPSVAVIPGMIRRAVVTSDTDSTIFTTQHWTQWYVGQLDFSERSNGIAATMVYLVSEMVKHVLAKLSANIGVAPKHLHKLSMKNEYIFPIFVLTSRSKHYYAYISAGEGNLYSDFETEIKGVALRSSSVPPDIIKRSKDLIQEIMDTVVAGKKISIVKILRDVAGIERGIIQSLESGSYSLMSRATIKTAESYKNPESSNYIYYDLWESVFAHKYGHAPAPPYSAIKVSVDANNPTKLKEWIAGFEDRSTADMFTQWLQKKGRKEVSTLFLPEDVLSGQGIPKEIVSGINVRQLVGGVMESFYLILESLGIYMKNDNLTRLVSDVDYNDNNQLTDMTQAA
jgi:hypothetical protein